MGIIKIGIDIGQKRDPTAIAVCEKEDRPSGRTRMVNKTIYHHKDYRTEGQGLIVQTIDPHEEGEVISCQAEILEEHYLVRHLERLPLGTPYPLVVERLVEITGKVAERAKCEPTLYVDATGVGQPIVDLLNASDIKGILYAVYFTHGDKLTRQGMQFTLGKAYLVSKLQALLQGGRVHLPHTKESENLARELLDYEIHVDEKANDTYGAFKVGSHDDLVTALGLAVFHESARWGPIQ